MKRFVTLVYFFLVLSPFTSGQVAEKIGGAAKEAVGKIDNIPIESVSRVGYVSAQYCKTCKEILEKYPGSPDGVYTIDPDSSGAIEAFECYCDMTTGGGGWTLVLLSNGPVTGCPQPGWTEVVNNVNLNGTLSEDITSFDLFLGVKNWNLLGTTARLDMGNSPSNLSHRAFYTFSLDPDNYYALVMSDESVTIHTEGTESPGMYTYHNGRPLSTYNADHDANGGSNCSTLFDDSAWWYGACWTGSFWGGGLESFQDAPYWTGSGSEYFSYGSIWLR